MRIRSGWTAIGSLGVLLAAGRAEAQVSQSKYALEYTALGVGAKSLGMGGSAVAIVRDATSGYWNPAGLSQITYPQIGGMYVSQFGGATTHNAVTGAMPVGSQNSLGATFLRFGTDDIPDTRFALAEADSNQNGKLDGNEVINENLVSSFSTADMLMLVSFARRTSDRFSYGLSGKVIYRTAGGIANAYGLGLDLGVQYRPVDRLALGVTVQDATTSFLSWSDGRAQELVTPTVKLGAAILQPLFDGTLTVAGDVDTRFENRGSAAQAALGRTSLDFHAGLEYLYRDALAFRGGYDDLGRWTAGVGLRLNQVRVDYAFAPTVDQLNAGASHRLSAQLSLEQPRFRRNR